MGTVKNIKKAATVASRPNQLAPAEDATPAGWTEFDPHEMVRTLQDLRTEAEDIEAEAKLLAEKTQEFHSRVDRVLQLAELGDPLVKDAEQYLDEADDRKWVKICVRETGDVLLLCSRLSTRQMLREMAIQEATDKSSRRHGLITLFWPADRDLPQWAKKRSQEAS